MRFQRKQLDELGKGHARSFADRVTSFVRRELPGEAGSATREEIDALIERARGYDLTLERTIVAFVITARFLGGDFDDRLPAAREVLRADKPEELRAIDLEDLTLATLENRSPEELRP